jgi:hypothetical protein
VCKADQVVVHRKSVRSARGAFAGYRHGEFCTSALSPNPIGLNMLMLRIRKHAELLLVQIARTRVVAKDKSCKGGNDSRKDKHDLRQYDRMMNFTNISLKGL